MNNSRAVRPGPLPLTLASLHFLRALFELTKPKIALASVLTVLAAYVTANGPHSLSGLLTLLCASGMAAGGSLAFNQWWERDTDPLMRRTRARPLPQQILSPRVALAWSLLLSLGGCLWLLAAFGLWCAGIGAATVLIYAGLYTPMKRKSRWATEVGALSGALPPLLGAAAMGDTASASVLATALLFWQMPHFFAIGWIHRQDYRAAGLPLLPATDPTGHRTAAWSLVYSFLLFLTLLIPLLTGKTGGVFGGVALGASLWILICAWKFYTAPNDRVPAAHRLFRVTLFAMPALLLVMIK